MSLFSLQLQIGMARNVTKYTRVAVATVVVWIVIVALAAWMRWNASINIKSASCSMLDPVDDPAYNMREVIKQLLLLEQHLADTLKLCRACTIKHLMLIIGLLEEAYWMAGTKQYPLLNECIKFFNDVLVRWPWRTKENVPDHERLRLLEALRAKRRALVEIYMLDGAASCGHDETATAHVRG